MTKLLEEAIAKVRALPERVQDETAEMLLWSIEALERPQPLDDAARAAISEGLAQARRGEFASDADINAIWKSRGL